MEKSQLLVRQLKAICTIRYLEKRRNLSTTCCEYFSHLIIIMLLILGFLLSDIVTFPDSNYAQVNVEVPPTIGTVNSINQILRGPLLTPTLNTYLSANDILSQFAIDDDVVSNLLAETAVGQQFGNLLIKGRIHLAPAGPYVDSFLSYLNRTTPALSLSEVRVHATEEQGVAYILEHLEERTLALIVLKQIEPAKVNYVIRVNYTTLPNTNRIVNRFSLGLDPTYQSYFLSGFFSLQSAVDRWVFEYIDEGRSDGGSCSGAGGSLLNTSQQLGGGFSLGTGTAGSLQPNTVVLTPMPVYAYDENPFYAAVGFLLGIAMTMATMYPMSRLVKSMVEEKESRMRELMKVMGLNSGVLQLSWVLTGVSVFLWISVSTAWIANATFLSFSDFSLLLIYFTLFSASLISLSFLLSTFFSNSKLAAIVAPVALFCLLLPRFVFFSTNSNEQFTSKVYASLLSPVAFAFGADFIAVAEGAGVGLQYNNMDDGEFSFRVVLQMLFVDSIVYLVLGWYLDLVMPQEFGTPMSPLFIVDPEYWFGYTFSQLWEIAWGTSIESVILAAQQQKASEMASLGVPPEMQDPADGEELLADDNDNDREIEKLSPLERDNVQAVVRGLVKCYANGKLAIRGISLAMCENQITCLLGHNGAGKSTFCSVLTGLFQPTSGSCSIYGHDLGEDLDSIRQITGVCPQQNVIFPGLTVREHLVFFASIKGFHGDSLENTVTGIIQDVGLTEKHNVTSGSLSGGMKRKLCLAMALVGDPKFVLLDEPTSGMDPYSRRSTWEILKRCKQGKVIVLTTHFMDEADILGDRILIMAHGKLQCSGSSLFLKSNYGVGYILTVILRARDPVLGVSSASAANAIEEKETGSPAGTGTERVGEMVEPDALLQALTCGISGFVPEVVVETAGAGEVVFRLPITSTSKFAQLFDYLSDNDSSLGISSYGLSITTLEQVFIKLAKRQQLVQDEVQDSEDVHIHNDVLSYAGHYLTLAWTLVRASQPYQMVVGHDHGLDEYLSSPAATCGHAVVQPGTPAGATATAAVGDEEEPKFVDLPGNISGVEAEGVLCSLPEAGGEVELSSLGEAVAGANMGGIEHVVEAPGVVHVLMPTDSEPTQLQMFQGMISHVGIQLLELMRKRFIVALRDFKGLFFQIVFPALQILAVLALLTVEINPAGRTIKFREETFNPNPYDAEVVDNTDINTVDGSGSTNDVTIEYLEEKFSNNRTKTCDAFEGSYCPDIFMSSHEVSGRYIEQTREVTVLSDGLGETIPLPHELTIDQNYTDNTFRMGTYVLDDVIPVNLTIHWEFVREILLSNSTNSSTAILNFLGLPPSGSIGGFSFAANQSEMELFPGTSLPDLVAGSGTGFLSDVIMGLTEQVTTVTVTDALNSLNVSLTTTPGSTDVSVDVVLFGLEFNVTVPNLFGNNSILDFVNSTNINITNINTTEFSLTVADELDGAIYNVDIGNAVVDLDARELILSDITIVATPSSDSTLEPFTVTVPGNITITAIEIAELLPEGRKEYSWQLRDVGVSILHNSTSPHGAAIFQGELLRGMFHQCSPLQYDEGTGISPEYLIKNHPLPITVQQSLEIKVVLALFASLFILVPLCYIPASFVTFVVRERAVKSKHLQLVSSVSPFLYWVATYIWDMLLYSVLAVLTIGILYAFGGGSDNVFLSNSESTVAMLLLLMTYGASAIPISYIYSFAFDNHSTAQISITMINFLTGFICVLAYFIMLNIPSTAEDAKVSVIFFRAFPPFNIGEGLINLSSQYFFNNLLGQDVGYMSWKVTGRNIVFMAMESVGYFGIVLLSESNWFRRFLNELDRQRVLNVLKFTDWLGLKGAGFGNDKPLDTDVAEEKKRVSTLRPDAAVLVIDDLTKCYTSSLVYGGQIKHAVRGLSLACPRNERFGLLGINGAGKTSTTQVLTGDTVMTGGDIHIGGRVLSDPLTRQLIGYCPQTDPLLDLMTGRETLWFFGRIRGNESIVAAAAACGITNPDGSLTPEELLAMRIDALIIEIGLKNYADKPCGTYSGGNKRKLSLAVALIGNPQLLLLDEPSSGMDALARRKMWDVIQKVSVGRTVILTTHSMDECEALCSRVGIMVSGQLQCLGSCQHLKSRFGAGYQIEIRCVMGSPGALTGTVDNNPEGNPINSLTNADVVWREWQVFAPDSVLEEKYDYYMRIRTFGAVALAPVFSALQRLKDTGVVQDFNLSQATLEQIFIGFAREQEEEPQAQGQAPNAGEMSQMTGSPAYVPITSKSIEQDQDQGQDGGDVVSTSV